MEKYDNLTSEEISIPYVLNMLSPTFYIYSNKVKILMSIIYIIVCLISFLLYTIVLHLFITRKELRTTGNIVSLSVLASGALLTFIVMPLVIIDLYSYDSDGSETFYAVLGYLFTMYIAYNTSSIIMIATMTAFQIRKMKSPHKKLPKKIILLLMALFFACSSAYPALMGFFGSKYGLPAVGIIITISYVLGFCLVCGSYLFVVYQMYKSNKRLQSTSSAIKGRSKRLQKTVQHILAAFVLTNILLWIRGILLIYSQYNPEFELKHERSLIHYETAGFTISTLAVIINPLIYFYSQKDLRREVLKLSLVQFIIKKTHLNLDVSDIHNSKISHQKVPDTPLTNRTVKTGCS